MAQEKKESKIINIDPVWPDVEETLCITSMSELTKANTKELRKQCTLLGLTHSGKNKGDLKALIKPYITAAVIIPSFSDSGIFIKMSDAGIKAFGQKLTEIKRKKKHACTQWKNVAVGFRDIMNKGVGANIPANSMANYFTLLNTLDAEQCACFQKKGVDHFGFASLFEDTKSDDEDIDIDDAKKGSGNIKKSLKKKKKPNKYPNFHELSSSDSNDNNNNNSQKKAKKKKVAIDPADKCLACEFYVDADSKKKISTLNKHVNSCHINENSGLEQLYKCQTCTKYYANKYIMSNHYR